MALHIVKGTDNFFDVFGVNPILGRTFAPGEDQDGKNDVVVLSYETWQQLARRLGHDLINQLSIILGFSEFLMSAMPESDARRADVQEIDKAARTAMLLVSQNLMAPK